MPRLVAFLRGINVGGRSVKKEKLQEAFTSLGFPKCLDLQAERERNF